MAPTRFLQACFSAPVAIFFAANVTDTGLLPQRLHWPGSSGVRCAVSAIRTFSRSSEDEQQPAVGSVDVLEDSSDLEAASLLIEVDGRPTTARELLASDVLDKKGLEDRERRLKAGATMKLYHQTTMPACKSILKTGFRIGSYGLAGGGVYFAHRPWHTQFKAQAWGCMVEALVRTGHVKQLPHKGQRNLTATDMVTEGYDSSWLPRGKPHGAMPEWVVYFRDQIIQITAYKSKRNGQRAGEYLAKRLKKETRLPQKDSALVKLSQAGPSGVKSRGQKSSSGSKSSRGQKPSDQKLSNARRTSQRRRRRRNGSASSSSSSYSSSTVAKHPSNRTAVEVENQELKDLAKAQQAKLTALENRLRQQAKLAAMEKRLHRIEGKLQAVETQAEAGRQRSLGKRKTTRTIAAHRSNTSGGPSTRTRKKAKSVDTSASNAVEAAQSSMPAGSIITVKGSEHVSD